MAGVQRWESVIGMKGGDGELSYAKNCSSQTNLLHSVRPILEETVLHMQKLPKCQIFAMADLGCSSSQNSVLTIEIILQAARLKYAAESASLPEFCCYFNDLPSNDFDSLFRRLSSDFIYRGTHKNRAASKVLSSKPDKACYYSEVVGSFHRRLFSAGSLNFVHSSCSLHWLSKVPDAFSDVTSPSYNRWDVFIARNGSYAVAHAYREQFKDDLTAFLSARALEIVHGGILFLVLPCRVSADPRHQGSLLALCGQLFSAAFRDLIHEGVLEEEKLHSFNLPFFSPTAEEFKMVVRSEGSFEMPRCQVLKGEKAGMVDEMERLRADTKLLGKHLSRQYRNGLESMVEAHIGGHLTEKLFQRIEIRASEMGQKCVTLMEDLTQLIAVLVRT